MEQPSSVKPVKPPKYLPPLAKAFWVEMYPLLAHRLQPTDLPDFALLCLNWNWIFLTDPLADPKTGVVHFAAQKLYSAKSKQFGLTPDSRRKVDPPKDETLADALSNIFQPVEKR